MITVNELSEPPICDCCERKVKEKRSRPILLVCDDMLCKDCWYEWYEGNEMAAAWNAWQAAWDGRQPEEGCQYPYVKIGKYIIAAYPEYIWIGLDGDGEGGGFDEPKLEAVIGAFYNENF